MAKLLEKIICKRLTSFVEENNLLSIYQSGFRQHRSTHDNIIRIIHDAKHGFAHKKMTGLVLFDIR